MAESLRPRVREMDEWSDFWSFRGVEAMDRSSWSMHEYTSSFNWKSGPAPLLGVEKKIQRTFIHPI